MPIQVGSYSLYLRVERSTTKVKPDPVNSNSNSSTITTAAMTTTSTKSNRVPHGPSLPSTGPSSKTQVTSTTQSKNEPNETSTTTSGRTIKLSNNGSDRYESPQTPMVSTTRESPPTGRRDTSTTVDR